MQNRYLEKFKDFPDWRLKNIIDQPDHFREEAINAAIHIYNERNGTAIPLISKPAKVKSEWVFKDIISGAEPLYNALDPRPFLHHFTSADLFTSITMVVLWFTLIETKEFFTTEYNLSNAFRLWPLFSALLLLSTTQLIYLTEHTFKNNIAGRIIQNLAFFLLYDLLVTTLDTLAFGEDFIMALDLSKIVILVFIFLPFEWLVTSLLSSFWPTSGRNLFKMKISLCSACVILMSIIYYYYMGVGIPHETNRYKQLTWDDFKGHVRPFSTYDASIRSQLFLDYDSLSESYKAYALQTASRSWVRKTASDDLRLLRHEQYHFNITELHARKMNVYISQYPGQSSDHYAERFSQLRLEKNSMQDAYDEEANHGMITDQQRKWEYEIDQSLKFYSSDPTPLVDSLSGVQFLFPLHPDMIQDIDAKRDYTRYTLMAYGMKIVMTIFQYEYLNDEIVSNTIEQYLEQDSLMHKYQINETRIETKHFKPEDNIIHNTVWIHDDYYLHRLEVQYIKSTSTAGYEYITEDLKQSFCISK